MGDEFVKATFSLRRRTLAHLRALARLQHGRSDRFVSYTLDRLIEEAVARLPDEQRQEVEREDEG